MFNRFQLHFIYIDIDIIYTVYIIRCGKIGGNISEHEYFIGAPDVQDTPIGAPTLRL